MLSRILFQIFNSRKIVTMELSLMAEVMAFYSHMPTATSSLSIPIPGLCEIARRPDVPVAQGSLEPLTGGRPIVADFVHGSGGLGNIFLSPPNLLICRSNN
ncbi:uncharacterized protein LOC105798385 [Gossypium raimondii]|uniref:uncharacterized protein LOC105798385 n=1 Tax=Gossypium raimondii TaxID=29730 RepID=UPI00227BD603|nr:uncharacterized protein LOC105798385 [Gossypium raimondii]